MVDLTQQDPAADMETDEEDASAVAPTSEGGSDAEPALADLAGRYGFTAARGAYEKLTQGTQKAREALQTARERILARQYDRSQTLLALAAGLGSPTRTGAFGETLSNVAQAMQAPVRERREFETQRERDLLGIDSAVLGLDERNAEAAFKLADLEARMQRQRDAESWSHVVMPNGELLMTSNRGRIFRTGIKGPKPAEEKKLTAAEEEVDKAYAKHYIEFIQTGAPDLAKQLAELKESRLVLRKEDAITGPIVGLLPKIARDYVMPRSASVQDTVEATIQRSLREILGPQFTKEEGERLIARAYNPRLEEWENARRLYRLIRQIETAYENKQAAARYFEKNGTIKGFEGSYHFTIDDFDPELADEEERLAEQAAAQESQGGGAEPSEQDLDEDEAPAIIPTINTKEERDALPKGAYYYDPKGVMRRKMQ